MQGGGAKGGGEDRMEEAQRMCHTGRRCHVGRTQAVEASPNARMHQLPLQAGAGAYCSHSPSPRQVCRWIRGKALGPGRAVASPTLPLLKRHQLARAGRRPARVLAATACPGCPPGRRPSLLAPGTALFVVVADQPAAAPGAQAAAATASR